jgi:enoyl-CoA hydratase/carnithine racemase
MESRLAELEVPDHDMVHKIIEEFAVKTDHTPQTYTLHGAARRVIDRCFNHGTVEEVIESLGQDGSKFALETKDTILKRSPTSLKITFEHLRRGAKKSWVECLRMERRLWQTVPVSIPKSVLTYSFLTTKRTYIVCSRFC